MRLMALSNRSALVAGNRCRRFLADDSERRSRHENPASSYYCVMRRAVFSARFRAIGTTLGRRRNRSARYVARRRR